MEETIIVKNNDLTITSNDIERVGTSLKAISEFVKTQLSEGIDNDFAMVPGTRKKSLLQPGAQKLMRLFGLGVRYSVLENELDRIENFALYSYMAEVYHLNTGTVIAQCEGTANSQETKYKEKKIYKDPKTGYKLSNPEIVPIPVCDIINTLKKMAQKRAMIGAVITATGASDFFTQDESEIIAQKEEKARTVDSSKFSESTSDLGEFVAQVNKFKGQKLKDIPRVELESYVDWIVKNKPGADGPLKELVDKARDYLRAAA